MYQYQYEHNDCQDERQCQTLTDFQLLFVIVTLLVFISLSLIIYHYATIHASTWAWTMPLSNIFASSSAATVVWYIFIGKNSRGFT